MSRVKINIETLRKRFIMKKKEACLEYMQKTPPREGDIGYYQRVADMFGYGHVDSVRKLARAIKLPNVRVNMQAKRTKVPLVERLKEYLKTHKKGVTVEGLTDIFDCGVAKIQKALEQLRKGGMNVNVTSAGVSLSPDIPISKPTVINVKAMGKKTYKFGFVTDNHLGSRYERLDVLNAMYEVFREEGVSVVFNAGNMIDGEARFNKFDLHKYGMDAQVEYLLEVYPHVPGITTQFITGDDHEGWYVQREGVDIGRYIELKAREIGRKDLVYLGHMEHDIVLEAKNGTTVIRVVHPGGGSAYAISYTPQKIVESYQGGEKPHVLLIGHYHKASYDYIRGVHTIQGGCTEDQTPFMRKKRLAAHLGGWVFEFTVGEHGEIVRFRQEFFPFYDRDFYDKKWRYYWKKK